MDKQKRIEKMANEIAKACPDLAQDSCNGIPCVTCLTTTLINAGYGNLKEFAERLRKEVRRIADIGSRLLLEQILDVTLKEYRID